MKRSFLTSLVAAALALLIAAPAVAQTAAAGATTNMDILAQKLKADKKLLVVQTVGLTDEEGKRFWPIYEAYQTDLQKVNVRLKTAIENYAKDWNAGTITDATATALTKESIAVEEELVALKKAQVTNLAGVIPATKIARWVQLENKIRAQINFELAAGIPFVR